MIDVLFTIDNCDVNIDRVLSSIAYQTCSSLINVWIIDIGVRNNYKEVIEFYSKFMNINQIMIDNLKKKEAIQYALDYTRSEYVIFINNNDLFLNSYSLQNLYNDVIENNYDCVFSNYFKTRDFKKFEEILEDDISDLCGKLYKRDFLKSNNIIFDKFDNDDYSGFNSLVKLYSSNINYLDCETYIKKENSEKEEMKKNYIDVIFWALNQFLKDSNYSYNFNISKLAYSTLYYIYVFFLDIENLDFLEEKIISIYNIYKHCSLSEEEELDIQQKNLLKFLNEGKKNIVLNKSCSFIKFLERWNIGND